MRANTSNKKNMCIAMKYVHVIVKFNIKHRILLLCTSVWIIL